MSGKTAWAVLFAGLLSAEDLYRKPPRAVLDVLDIPPTPQAIASPTSGHVLLVQPVGNPAIADLARPMLRLAGVRIDPATHGARLTAYAIGLSLLDTRGGAERRIALPPNPRLSTPQWSPDGRSFAFLNSTANSTELWVAGTAAGKARRVAANVNAAYGDAVRWMPGGASLLVHLVAAGRGGAPQPRAVPAGPNIQESDGKSKALWTFQDLLKSPHDEQLFDHYATSQLAVIDAATGKAAPLGRPAIFELSVPSPDGRYVLISRVARPYSWLHPASMFPHEVEVWDRTGKLARKVAATPLADVVPDGAPPGPRHFAWKPSEPATLVWVEPLDGGDPKKSVPHRDRALEWKAPFAAASAEILRVEHRLTSLAWLEKDDAALATDYDRRRRWTRRFLIRPGGEPRLLASRNVGDRYGDPGQPVSRLLPNGHSAIAQAGGAIFLHSLGATREGDRPFLDRLDLATGRTERLFRSSESAYEDFLALLAPDGSRFLTRRESRSEPPNYFVREAAGPPRPLTRLPDPAPQLRKISKQLVKYKRVDGVDLTFTLLLPPDYQPGTRLPTVVWAYPLEYTDASTAGQVSGSETRFVTMTGASHLFYLLAGYAVLDNAAMPVVGDPETVNNTYVEQIVNSAKAAIDKAVEMGVTDRDRVGVGGHSYGAFMTANLLAHSDLFRAGVARSGAHNRTLTPFGFQSERRTLWDAPDVYLRMSPLMNANKIDEPLLLVHGEADNNSGTFPIQSERMYQAIRGNGGAVRLVMLPHESHGYQARESVEHVLAEMIGWFDRHVKDPPPRAVRP